MAMQVSDWRSGKKVAGCLEYLGDKKLFTDITFVFPKDGGKTCTAHKLVLSMRSAVFEAMFYGSVSETNVDVTIEDIDADTFEQLLRFMYCDTTDLNGDNVLKCLFAAKKYCLDDLIVCCKTFLADSITTDTVCTIHEQAKFFDEPDLQEKCRIYLLKNTSAVFKGPDVVKLSKESLSSFLDDNLPTNELELFHAVLRWSDEECRKRDIDSTPENKRNVLEGILEKIRFPLMKLTEFAEDVTPSKILNDREISELFQFLVTRKTTTPGRVAQYVSLPRETFTSVFALDLSKATSSSFSTKKKTNMYSMVLESSHDIDLIALTFGQQHKFKSLVVRHADSGDEIYRISPLGESVCDDQIKKFKINTKVTIAKQTKSIVVLESEALTKQRNLNRYYMESFTENMSIDHKEICLKHEQGEISIVVSEIPIDLTEIRYTLCSDNPGKHRSEQQLSKTNQKKKHARK